MVSGLSDSLVTAWHCSGTLLKCCLHGLEVLVDACSTNFDEVIGGLGWLLVLTSGGLGRLGWLGWFVVLTSGAPFLSESLLELCHVSLLQGFNSLLSVGCRHALEVSSNLLVLHHAVETSLS